MARRCIPSWPLVGEQGWRLNQSRPPTSSYVWRCCRILGNIGSGRRGAASTTARADRSHHPGSRQVKRPGAGSSAAELVETHAPLRALRSASAGMAGARRRTCCRRNWSTRAGEKSRAGGRQWKRATLYGLLVYNGRRVHYGRINPQHARELFIRQALVPGEIDTRLPFVAHNRKLIAGIEKLEHQTRRPDILVDDELIYAFYDRQLPADISQTASLEKWVNGLDKAAAAPAAYARRTDAPRGGRRDHRRVSQESRVAGRGDAAGLSLRAGLAARYGVTLSVPRSRSTSSTRSAANGWCRACSRKKPTCSSRCRRSCAAIACRCPTTRRASTNAGTSARPTPAGPGRCADRRHVGPGTGAPGARRLQAGNAAGAPVHELQGGRRAWPDAGRRAQSGAAQGRIGQAGPGDLPATGGARFRTWRKRWRTKT